MVDGVWSRKMTKSASPKIPCLMRLTWRKVCFCPSWVGFVPKLLQKPTETYVVVNQNDPTKPNINSKTLYSNHIHLLAISNIISTFYIVIVFIVIDSTFKFSILATSNMSFRVCCTKCNVLPDSNHANHMTVLHLLSSVSHQSPCALIPNIHLPLCVHPKDWLW
jgi:hypothetical protein